MSSSNYYHLMEKYSNLKQQTEKEKKEYETFLTKLNRVKEALSVRGTLKRVERNFSDGGYIDTSGTLDRGKLKECYNNLEDSYEILVSIIKKTEATIENLKSKINEYTSLYNQAKTNYRNAIREASMN